jgi:tRNA threonylcarbamoyladenosine biosynthesis protein TsaB
MNLLSIDTSTDVASVALLCEGVAHELKQANVKTHAECILPMISQLIKITGMPLTDLNGILFSRGPGSFTGLRVACSVAKGLACAYDIPLIPVSTLGAIAFRARQFDESVPVLAVLDARMHEWYWAYFEDYEYKMVERVSKAQDIMLPEEKPFILAGLGIDICEKTLAPAITARIINREVLYPDARTMIYFAMHTKIRSVKAAKARPVYVRNRVIQGG